MFYLFLIPPSILLVILAYICILRGYWCNKCKNLITYYGLNNCCVLCERKINDTVKPWHLLTKCKFYKAKE